MDQRVRAGQADPQDPHRLVALEALSSLEIRCRPGVLSDRVFQGGRCDPATLPNRVPHAVLVDPHHLADQGLHSVLRNPDLRGDR